jgi:pimeloyl-ACP methyl ester carboxylesterase
MAAYADLQWKGKGDLALYARDYAPVGGGTRSPVICIHGLTRNSADFEDVAPWIAGQGRRVIAVDVRGRGRSARDPDPKRYAPPVYASDVLALMDHAKIPQAVFIGTSMGGLITMVIAMKRLKAIAGAVLNDVGPMINIAGLNRIRGYVGKGKPVETWSDAAELIKGINGVAFPDNTDEDWLRFARRTFREDANGKIILDYDPQIAASVASAKVKTTSFLAKLLYKRLARSRPTLLIRGANSDIVGPEEARYMREAAPKLRYAEVPRVGHAPMLTEPAAREALQAFLADVP